MARLIEAGIEISAIREPRDMLPLVARLACDVLDCERATLFLADTDRREFVTEIVTQLEIQEIRVPFGQGIVGLVAECGQPICLNSPQDDPHWNREVDRQTGFRTRNLLTLPVHTGSNSEVVAVLQLVNHRGGHFTPCDRRHASMFASYAAAALERIQLHQSQIANTSFQQAMEVARQIQESFLPRTRPILKGANVSTWWRPAEYVSGDYYDWLTLPDGRTLFVTADVSGHGIGPSLIMASLRAMLHVLVQTYTDLQILFDHLAAAIEVDTNSHHFVTLGMLAIDPCTWQIECLNAGHQPLLLMPGNSTTAQQFLPTALPIGFPRSLANLPLHHWELQPGDLIIMGTDGVLEARNAGGEMYGRHRLVESLVNVRHLPNVNLAETAGKSLDLFRGSISQADDATLLIVARDSTPYSQETHC